MFRYMCRASSGARALIAKSNDRLPTVTASLMTALDCQVRHHSIEGQKGSAKFMEGEVNPRFTSEGSFKKLNPETMPHYVKATIQNSRRELQLPEVDDWYKFAEEAVYIRTQSGPLWVGPDDPRAAKIMRRKLKYEENPMQVPRRATGPDQAKELEEHPYRRFFVSPSDPRDPLTIAEGLWKAGYIKEHDVKFVAARMDYKERPPVVTIMGHVDHGKTTLLDYLRNTNVAAGEAGGITQSIGAFTVRRNGSRITFIDTPGHAAFSEMRKAGAQITDVIILVVSVTDGVQPQTKEVIQLANENGVPLVVAISKIDKGEDNLANVKRQLIEAGVALDKGDVLLSRISAVEGLGIDDLLDNVLLQAATCELQTPTKARAEVNTIDSKVPEANTQVAGIVRTGVLKPGMTMVSGTSWGVIQRLLDETGKVELKEADVGTPVIMEGFKVLPKPGVVMMQVSSPDHGEKFYKLMMDVYRIEGRREEYLQMLGLEAAGQIFRRKSQHRERMIKNVPFNIMVRAGTFGQLQALLRLIYELPALEGINLQVIFTEVGGLNNADIVKINTQQLGAVLIFGNVKDFNQIQLPSYLECYRFDVVYHGVNWLKAKLVSLLPKIQEERILAFAVCKEVFRASQAGTGNAGGMGIKQGKLMGNAEVVRVMRKSKDGELEPVYEGKIKELRRFKEIVPFVDQGLDCGVILHNGFNFREGDILQQVEYYEVDRDVEQEYAKAEERETAARLQAQQEAEAEEAQGGPGADAPVA